MLAHPDRGGIAPELRAAIAAACTLPGTLRTVYQPIVDLQRATVAGYEALTRFELAPRLGPDRWFALAHEAGLGARLEAAALRSALAGRAALPPNCFLTLNVIPDSLLADEVLDLLSGIADLRGIVIELTEQAPVDDYDALSTALAPLREAGAMVAVDDAGAGFASLTHITRLRPELVKIDREHVAGIDADPAKVAAVQALGEFASRLDGWIVAEGVETRAELDVLVDLGVPLAQGWFLGRPSPALAGVHDDVLAAHAERAARRDAGGIGELLERAVCVGAGEPDGAVAKAFAAAASLHAVVIVDEHLRPLGLEHRQLGRDRSAAMSVTFDTPLASIVHRLLARPAESRFDPIVACDELGRTVGLLTVERVLRTLATAAEQRAPQQA